MFAVVGIVDTKLPNQVDLQYVQERVFSRFNGIGDISDISGMYCFVFAYQL